MSDSEDQASYDGPSKSQLKREDAELQALGLRLTGLSKAQIAAFPVQENLRDALIEYKRITSHEARRRHVKRIGKLLREHDADAVALAMDKVDPSSSLSMQATHSAQRWCDRLIAEGNAAVTAFVDQYPQVEIQPLRQMLRKASKTADPTKPTPAQRELLRFVRQVIVAGA
ncbi:MAG: DUF615 domain-containing protein [Oceanococcus sp.]|nr:MAG: DUF615 domain-containing protein [Oceanococcus sp.]